MIEYTRIAVVGSRRRATLVLPDDDPVAVLMPDIAALLGEPTAPEGHVLVTSLGDQLSTTESLAAQNIVDGTVLRLLPVVDAPAPPEVSDVTDTVAERQDATRLGWNGGHRAVLTGIVLGALTFTCTTAASDQTWFAPTVLSTSLGLSALLARSASPRVGLVAAAPALGALPHTMTVATELLPALSPAVVPLALGAAALLLGAAGGVRAALGGILGVLFAGVAVSLSLIGASPTATAAVIAVLVTGALGVLPSAALALAGVTLLDDHALAGEPIERVSVLTRVADAYETFTWAVAICGSFGAFAIATLLSKPDAFTALLGAALVSVMLLRTRIMPRAIQAWSLWVAVLFGVISALRLSQAWAAEVVVSWSAGAAVLTVLFGFLRPRAHSRVRIRRAGDVLEAFAAVAMIPLVLGVFGVYSSLLSTFS